MMVTFWSAILGGITLGGTYALVSLGLVLMFRGTGMFNFAYGQFMLLPAYFVARWQAEGVSIWIAGPGGLLMIAVLGAVFYRTVLQRTVGLALFMPVIATLGFAAVLDGVIGILFGSAEYVLTLPVPSGIIQVGGAGADKGQILIAIGGLAIAVAIAVVLRVTNFGIRVKAAGQDPVLASQGGINVTWLFVGTWAVASALAGLAGIIYGSENVVNSGMVMVLFGVLPAIMLGGIDSVMGAVVGGVLIALLQGFTSAFLGGDLVNIATYAVLVAVILFRPQGLFGTRHVTRL
jgi:branched-chain amino acid transport system permease protein